jgi:hypothetical protein
MAELLREFPGWFAAKLALNEAGCWLWRGRVSGVSGYGYVDVAGRTRSVHRLAFELAYGTELPGRGSPGHRQVDHLCHNSARMCAGGAGCLHRRCANPTHLRLVTAYENTEASVNTVAHRNRRKTHCVNGHEFTAMNTAVRRRRGGGRVCRTCKRSRRRASKA